MVKIKAIDKIKYAKMAKADVRCLLRSDKDRRVLIKAFRDAGYLGLADVLEDAQKYIPDILASKLL